jgi:hypothetical protein
VSFVAKEVFILQTMKEFLQWESFSRDTIDVKRAYIDLAGDLVTGVLLSQIIYWHLPNKETGENKLKIFKEGRYWLAKSRKDWWDECRISQKQFDRSIKILEDSNLVITKIFKFNGMPTKHISLNSEVFLEKLNALIEGKNVIDEKVKTNESSIINDNLVFDERVKTNLPKGENPISHNGDSVIDERVKSITKNTTENYSENNQSNLMEFDSIDSLIHFYKDKYNLPYERVLQVYDRIIPQYKAGNVKKFTPYFEAALEQEKIDYERNKFIY